MAAEINIGGVTFKGGKIFGVLIALSTAVGALYGGFEVYKRYLDMEQKINEFVAPDLSGFDKKIELSKAEMDKRLELIEQELDMIKTEMSMILEEVSLVASTAKELKVAERVYGNRPEYKGKKGILSTTCKTE